MSANRSFARSATFAAVVTLALVGLVTVVLLWADYFGVVSLWTYDHGTPSCVTM